MEDIYTYVNAVLERKGHMVIAVAEGAGQEHVATGQKDSTGHTIYGDIGIYLRDRLNAHLKPSGGRTFYIDPSYTCDAPPWPGASLPVTVCPRPYFSWPSLTTARRHHPPHAQYTLGAHRAE